MGDARDTNPSPVDVSLSEKEIIMRLEHFVNIQELQELNMKKHTIYKVPYNLREVEKEAYTPNCISIGPIFLGVEKLEPMQVQKLRFFHFFRNRVCVSNEQAMKNYRAYLVRENNQIQECYAEKLSDETKEKFVDMMLLDTVFIMELFLRNCERKSHSSKHEQELQQSKSFREINSEDLIMTQSWLISNIARDLILLENQIPFFVLQKLYDDVVPCHKKQEHTGFVDLAEEYFAFYNTQMSSSRENGTKKHFFCCSLRKSKSKDTSKHLCDKPKHFTDLIRRFYLPSERKICGVPHVLRTATKLQDSGVSFEKGDAKRRLLDITFDKTPFLSLFLCFGCLPFLNHFKARLRIPQLKVDQNTECVLRNLIAFEQCHYPKEPYICNYVSLIDSLIHTQLDVELLVEKEVIVHELGSHKEVASLVNRLCKHVFTNSTCYYKTIDKLNEHYMKGWNHTVAALRLVYFRDLWRASSTVVGITVLVFAVFQFLRVWRFLF